MARRGANFVPRLGWYKARQCGRVVIPGKGTVYLGATGCWPSKRHKPPPIVQEEYQREINDWLRYRDDRGESHPPEPGLSIKRLVAAYLRHCLRYYRKRGQPTSTVAAVRQAVRPVVQLHGSLPAADFRPAHLRSVRERLEQSGTQSRTTINEHLGRIKRMFRWGAEEELIPEEVWLRLTAVRGLEPGRTPAREPVPVPPVEADVVAQTLPHLPAVLAAMVRVQQLTGMRPEEVCGMRVEDLQTRGSVWKYTVSRDWNKVAHRGISKVVWLGPRAQAILHPYLEAAGHRGDNVLWPLQRGRGSFTPKQYGRRIRLACRAAGIPQWSPNQLRHSRATETRERYGIEGVQAELGHSTVAQSQVYAARQEALARQIALEQG